MSHHGKLSYGRNPLLAHDNRYATLGKRNADRTIQPRRHHTAAENAKDPLLPPFSLIRDFRRQNTRGNVSKISVNHACYRQIGSKSTNHSPLAWRKEGQKVTLVVVIGGFRSDLSITRMIDGNFGNVSAGVFWFGKSRIKENGGKQLLLSLIGTPYTHEKYPDRYAVQNGWRKWTP